MSTFGIHVCLFYLLALGVARCPYCDYASHLEFLSTIKIRIFYEDTFCLRASNRLELGYVERRFEHYTGNNTY